MKLSKYFHARELNKNVFAIYNSLMMSPIFVDYNKLNNIKNFNVDEEERKVLLDSGIYIKDDQDDLKARQKMIEIYKKFIKMPTFAYFAVTNQCNLRCKYCFIENNSCTNKFEYMSFDVAKIAVDKIDNFCMDNNIDSFEIIFYGGEPLLCFDLIKRVLEYANTKHTKFTYTVITNATLLDDEVIAFLRDTDGKLGVSIDGPKELNDFNRIYASGTGSVYDTIIEKLNKLKDNNINFNLSITISEEFLKKQDEVLKWLKGLGVNKIAYNIMHLTDRNIDWKKLYEDTSYFLIKSNEELEGLNVNEDRINRNWNYFVEGKFKFSDCGATGANQITIKPNGEVVICHGDIKTGKNVVGNILNDSIAEIVKNTQNNMWVDRSPIMRDERQTCPALYVCGGGCGNEALHLFGSVDSLDRPFCIYSLISLDNILSRCYSNLEKEVKNVSRN